MAWSRRPSAGTTSPSEIATDDSEAAPGICDRSSRREPRGREPGGVCIRPAGPGRAWVAVAARDVPRSRRQLHTDGRTGPVRLAALAAQQLLEGVLQHRHLQPGAGTMRLPEGHEGGIVRGRPEDAAQEGRWRLPQPVQLPGRCDSIFVCDAGFFAADCSTYLDLDGKPRLIDDEWEGRVRPPPRIYIYPLPPKFNGHVDLRFTDRPWSR